MIKRITTKLIDIFYSIPRILFINFYKQLIRIRIFNIKRIPSNKSAIFAINHTADADPIIILSALKKKIYFIAESENFNNWISNFFMRKFANCVPIFKKQFAKNAKSFKELFSISDKKNVFFGIFPEGILNKKADFKQFHKGAAYFSYKTRLPIIPIYMHNTNRGPESKKWLLTNRITRGIISLIINTFRKINIFIGEPINPMAENIMEDFKDLTDKRAYKQIIEDINKALKEEFLELKDEADSLFGNLKEENDSSASCIEDEIDDEDFIENPKKLKS